MSARAAEKVDDDLWSAIGDPTRRRLLDLLLAGGDGTATTLSQQLPVTRQAVAKHLGVLDRVGLVRAAAAGREKRYRIDEAQLARAVAQLNAVGSTWDARLRRIKSDRRGDRNKPSTTTRRHRRNEMVDILHRVGITATPEQVYAALTTSTGWPRGGRRTRPATATARCGSASATSAGST